MTVMTTVVSSVTCCMLLLVRHAAKSHAVDGPETDCA